MKKALLSKVLLLTAMTMLLAAASLASAQKRGGTLVAAWQQDPVGLDPAITSAQSSYQVLENVLDTLVTYDNSGKLVPSLATSWDISDDGLTYTFHLRKDVKFSNGQPLTAADVVYTYKRILNPKTGSGNAYKLAGVKDISAPDGHTVVLKLDAPDAALLGHLALDKTLGIITKKNVDDGTINTDPIGTGPFMITDYQPGSEVVLKRNPHYWKKGLPYLDEVDIKIITDDSVREAALISGDIDWAFTVPPQDVKRLKENKDIVVGSSPEDAYWYIASNVKHSPLNNVQVRHAIAYAINRKQIAQAARFGQAKINQGPIPASSRWHFDYAPYEHNPAKAKKLLAAAGYPDGFDLEIMVTTQYEESIRAAQVVQANLAQVGIHAKIDTLEWADWLQQEGAGKYDTYICDWNGLVDPDDYFYAQQKTGEPFNFTGYSNPELDKLLVKGRQTQGFDARYKIYQQVDKLVVDGAPYIYLYNPFNNAAWRTYVKGYTARADQAVRFVSVWLDK